MAEAEAKDYTDRIYADGQTPSNEYPGYDTEQSDRVAPVLELWEIWNSHLLPLLPGPLWPLVVVPDRILSMDLIELFDI